MTELQNAIAIYQSADGTTQLDVRLEQDLADPAANERGFCYYAREYPDALKKYISGRRAGRKRND